MEDFTPPKPCDMPYMFLPALQTLQPLWEFWRPQHIGVSQFAAYPVAGKDFVYKAKLLSIVCSTHSLHVPSMPSNSATTLGILVTTTYRGQAICRLSGRRKGLRV